MHGFGHLLLIAGVALLGASSALAQSACTTDYCIRSQSLSYETPPGWPAVPVEPCCTMYWGSLPGGINWINGAPIVICSGNAEFATTFPNCGDPSNLSQDFPLSYERPMIGIGVAWPNAKDYRYEMQAVPLLAGSDGTCAEYAGHSSKPAKWWVYELKAPKRGSYVFTAVVSFRRGENGYYAVLDRCTLTPPSAAVRP